MEQRDTLAVRPTRRAFVGAAAAGLAAAACRRTTHVEPASSQASGTAAAGRMPVGFVSHGAPTLALDAVKGAPSVRPRRPRAR